jgi:predicted RNA-binding protein YlqC (UPF0109 family)
MKESQQKEAVEFVEVLVRALVDDIDAVSVKVWHAIGDQLTLQIRVTPNDFGKVIGKMGRTARAMRTIIGAFAMREKLNISLDIGEAK